jgi:hypothetical protein
MQESGLRQKKIVSNQQNKKVSGHTTIGCTHRVGSVLHYWSNRTLVIYYHEKQI